MKNDVEIIIRDFHKTLLNIIDDFGLKEININENEIAEFCNLINDNNLIYLDDDSANEAGLEGKILPPGYFMNLTTKFIYEIFIKGGPDLFASKIIKGLIHTKSDVEFFKPILMNKKYKIKIELSEPIKKEGAKGTYYSIIFQISLLDNEFNVYAVDNHDFFFPI